MENTKQLNIRVDNLIPTLLEGCNSIVCGNGDYTVNFSFDEEWAEHNVKTALFVCGGKTYDSVFEGNICEVPELDDGTICYIGVVSGKIGEDNAKPKKKTSIWCEVCAIPSITSIAKEPKSPDPDVYVEFMALLNKYIEGSGTGGGGQIVVDQTYNPDSENAQSGRAIDGLVQKLVQNSDEAFAMVVERIETNTESIAEINRTGEVIISNVSANSKAITKESERAKQAEESLSTQLDIWQQASLTTFNAVSATIEDKTKIWYANDPTGEIILPAKVVHATSYLYNIFLTPVKLNDGDMLKVIVNGTEYVGEVEFTYGETPDELVFECVIDGKVLFRQFAQEYTAFVFLLDSDLDGATVEIYRVNAEPVYNKLPEEYLPNSVVLKSKPTEGLAYELSEDGTYYICTGIGTATDTDIVIASEIDGIPVKEVGYAAFGNGPVFETIESVIIPKGVTSIGATAFWGLHNLKRIYIPDSVGFAGNDLFWEYATNLTIYCEAQSQPPTWDVEYWNSGNAPVIWGYSYADNFNDVNKSIGDVYKAIGDISTALDELHAYAQALISGGATE